MSTLSDSAAVSPTTTAAYHSLPARLAAGAVCAMLGLGMLAGIGFAGSVQVHNAAHDTRHAVGFPCH